MPDEQEIRDVDDGYSDVDDDKSIADQVFDEKIDTETSWGSNLWKPQYDFRC